MTHHSTDSQGMHTESATFRGIPEALVLFAVALAVRLINIDHPGYYDEYYHALAAGSTFGDEGQAGQGFIYGRAPYFTWLVSVFIRLFGDDLVTARMPSVLAGCLTVAVLYLVTRSVAGPVAGRVSALLLCFDPHSIFLSQLCRFYALHGLSFLLASLALYRAAYGPLRSWKTALYALISAGLLFYSQVLTPITTVGLAALLLWAATVIEWHKLRSFTAADIAILLIFVIGAAIAAYTFVPFGHIVSYYRGAPIFLEDYRWSFGYYPERLLDYYPLIMGILPLAVLAGLHRFRRFTWFCAVTFGVAVMVHSGAAAKQMRYIYYVMPYMYALVGIATAVAWPGIKRLSRQVLLAVPPVRLLPVSWSGPLALMLSTVVVLIAVMSNKGFRVAYGMLTATHADWPANYYDHIPSDWAAATPTLRKLAADSDVIISSSGIKALYYLGRFDYDLLLTLARETTTGTEFGNDYRHGRPVIASPQALATITSENKSGIVIIDEIHWRQPAFVPDEVADYLEQHMQRLDMPGQWRLIVFRWPVAGNG